jgi:hypothetical protein
MQPDAIPGDHLGEEFQKVPPVAEIPVYGFSLKGILLSPRNLVESDQDTPNTWLVLGVRRVFQALFFDLSDRGLRQCPWESPRHRLAPAMSKTIAASIRRYCQKTRPKIACSVRLDRRSQFALYASESVCCLGDGEHMILRSPAQFTCLFPDVSLPLRQHEKNVWSHPCAGGKRVGPTAREDQPRRNSCRPVVGPSRLEPGS